ncbi:MAG: hypothetical protein KDE27_20870 [Planctomycetes bacterium]|nr:hypothetical protein [Planctomycetota bacterium]
MRELRSFAAAVGLALPFCAGCRSVAYAPCPVELATSLPADAFERCRGVLAGRFGPIALADPAGFLLETDWILVDEPPGRRRASVFRDGDGLAVMVEARFLVEPPVGLPYWSSVRGDPRAERELADLLAGALVGDGDG